jgi:uncharacterized protein YdhG (YjbR/CyaY superfamily)
MQAASKTRFRTVEQYLAALPSPARALMQEMRKTIRQAAPGAEELISYNIPAFRLNGLLVWYAAFKKHIGFYPRVSGMEAFSKELSAYKRAKGSVQFPLDEPLPLNLVARIVKYRVKENREQATAKRR